MTPHLCTRTQVRGISDSEYNILIVLQPNTFALLKIGVAVFISCLEKRMLNSFYLVLNEILHAFCKVFCHHMFYAYIKLLGSVYHKELNNSLRMNHMQYLLHLCKPHSTPGGRDHFSRHLFGHPSLYLRHWTNIFIQKKAHMQAFNFALTGS